MDMSRACEAPIHAPLNAADEAHPLYPEYRRYRAAMTRQLVNCPSFTNWRREHEDSLESERIRNHPRHGDYVTWLRTRVHTVPPTAEYKIFWRWLDTETPS